MKRKSLNVKFSLEDKLDRIFECVVHSVPDDVERSLLHAYIACLTFDELCESILRTLDAQAPLRLALRNRLLRLLRLRANVYTERLALLAQEACSCGASNKTLRTRVDALLSAIYTWLPVSTRHRVLEFWIDSGTRGAAGRWLKAIGSDEMLFDPSAILTYWQKSNDYRAAKILAYQADMSFLDRILLELAVHCEVGWIISKAALRASTISAEVWDVIRDKQPASYAYLCAMTDRKITEEQAQALIDDLPIGAIGNGRGLVVWSIGQLGMISVLDLVRDDHKRRSADRYHSGRPSSP